MLVRERSYRSLLASLIDSRILQSDAFMSCDDDIKADILAAVAWLQDLPVNLCPHVTNEEMAHNLKTFQEEKAKFEAEQAQAN